MAKKGKERSEVEALRGEVRSLRCENRQLKKTLGRFEKRMHRVQDVEDLIEEMEMQATAPVPTKCPNCTKGTLSVTDLGVRLMTVCSDCDYRLARKK